MEEVALSETEARYYSDLFLCCDVDKTGKIPMLKAMELYRSANLSNDAIRDIASLAGIPQTALHISRAQFYASLKLIAAFQAAMPLRQELVAATVQLPLPRFSWKLDTLSTGDVMSKNSNGITAFLPPVAERRSSLSRRNEWHDDGFSSVSTAAATVVSGSRRSSGVSAAVQQQELNTSQHLDTHCCNDSDVEQNETNCGAIFVGSGGVGDVAAGTDNREEQRCGGSPEAWSTNSDSPTPTNSVAERPWVKETLWHGLLGDEHRQLLGTEEESSDRHSSDDDDEENATDLETVYQITPEQREYYFKQFKVVQHDPNGLVSGHVARVFFEKSRIPVEELRHIWQLCDVTRDGALSLAEFTAAMHLVVLRRNNIPLPVVLPACLHPSVLQHSTLVSQMPITHEPPEADLLHLHDDDDDEDNTVINAMATAATSATRAEKNMMNLSAISTSSQVSNNSRQGLRVLTTTTTPPPLTTLQLAPTLTQNRSISNSPSAVESSSVASPNFAQSATVLVNKALGFADAPATEWTKFTASPIEKVSSPGPKPVNFDMQRTAQAVVSDPQILHPVPLRVTPVAGSLSVGEVQSTNADVELTTTRTDNTVTNNNNNDNANNLVATVTTIVSTTISSNASTAHHRDSLPNSSSSNNNSDLRAIQRPQAKKLPTKNIGALPPPPQREPSIGSVGGPAIEEPSIAAPLKLAVSGNCALNGNQQFIAGKKDPPPPLPPPRPSSHRHGRSSSLDLNKFKVSAPAAAQQPEIIAQASFDLQTTTGFADFTQFANSTHENIAEENLYSLPPQNITSGRGEASAIAALPPSRFALQTNQRVSAFEIYRKPETPRNSQSPPTLQSQQQLQQQQQQQQPQTTVLNDTAAVIKQYISRILKQPTFLPETTVGAASSATAAAAASSAAAANSTATNLYEKRINAISDTLKHVSFKSEDNTCEVLRHLRDQNNLLLRICSDLSDEMLTLQMQKEEIRIRLEAARMANDGIVHADVTAVEVARTASSISAPVTANITGGSGSSSGVQSNV